MKTLICADLHISNNDRFGNSVEQDNIRYDERALYKVNTFCDIVNKESPDRVILCGDVWNSIRISEYIRSYFFSAIAELKCQIFEVAGNHSSTNGMTIGLSESLISSNYSIIKPRTGISIDGFDFIGFCKDESDFREILTKVSSNKYLFCHQDYMNIPEYKNIFAGHIHEHTVNNNWVSIGSLFKTSFAEESTDNGYIILDTETDEWKFVKHEDIKIKTFAEPVDFTDGEYHTVRYKFSVTPDEFISIDQKAIKSEYKKTVVEFDLEIIIGDVIANKEVSLDDRMKQFYIDEKVTEDEKEFEQAVMEEISEEN